MNVNSFSKKFKNIFMEELEKSGKMPGQIGKIFQ